MLIRNVSYSILCAALQRANEYFDGNITLKAATLAGRTREGGQKWRVQLGVYATTIRTPKPLLPVSERALRLRQARRVACLMTGKPYTERGSGYTVETAPGVRTAYSYRTGKVKRIAAACWHAHGRFFDALPREVVIVSDANLLIETYPLTAPASLREGGRLASVAIVTGRRADFPGGGVIRYRPGDPWQDFNIGSQMCPLMMSEACECEGSMP